jgi:addiction module HigA family antidote
MLSHQFLRPLRISQSALARHIGVDFPAISEIVTGKRGLSVEMCYKIAGAVGPSPEFWWGLQESREFTAAREKLRAAGRLPRGKLMPRVAAAVAKARAHYEKSVERALAREAKEKEKRPRAPKAPRPAPARSVTAHAKAPVHGRRASA